MDEKLIAPALVAGKVLTDARQTDNIVNYLTKHVPKIFAVSTFLGT
jgi:hypothetical protein